MVLLDSLCKECQYKYRSSNLRDENNRKFIHISNFCEKCQKMFSQSQLRDKKPSEVDKMATRYKIVGKGMTFRNAGSYGLKELAEKKAKEIRRLRKEAGAPYKSIKVKKFDASK